MRKASQSSIKVEKLKDLFTVLSKEQGLNGNVLVGDQGEIIYKEAFGYANFETKEPLMVNSMFDLASIAKTFTAVAIMLLKEQGKLSYNDMLDSFFPAFPYQHVTVKHLLTHTSGMPHYEPLFSEHWDKTKIANNDDVIELLMRHTPDILFQPSEQWAYSNTGYVLLAKIIEATSGMSYQNFLDRFIFQPLQMNRTTVLNRRYIPRVIPNYVYGYIYSYEHKKYVLPEEIEETRYVYYLDGLQGDGGIGSTIEDLWKWDRALYTEQLVTHETLQEAFQQTNLKDRTKVTYGYGWGVGNREPVGKIISHNGMWPGYETMLMRYTDEDKTIIFLNNMPQGGTWFEEIIMAAENILFDCEFSIPQLPPIREEVEINLEACKKYIGIYKWEIGEEIEVSIKNNRLFFKIIGQQDIELLPQSETKFFVRIAELEIEFIIANDGKVYELIIDTGEKSKAIRTC